MLSPITWGLVVTWLVIVVQRLIELRIARRHEAWARAQGAREFGADHYPLFFVLHTGWLLAWPIEAWLRGPTLAPMWVIYALAFGGAQVLRYWALATLGRRWNTRILVLAGVQRVKRGPYRMMAHPNYVAVAIELAVVPLVFAADWTAAIVSIANAGLLLGIRIPAEMHALAHAERSNRSG